MKENLLSIKSLFAIKINTISLQLTKLNKNKLVVNFLKDSSWTIFGNFFGKGLTFFSGLLIARFLGSTSFGYFSFFKTTITSLGFISLFGLNIHITSSIAKEKSNQVIKQNIGIALVLILLLSSISSIGALIFLQDSFFFINKGNYIFLLLIFITTFSFSIINLMNGIYAGLSWFKKLSLINLFMGVLNIVILILLTKKYLLDGAVIGYCLISVTIVGIFMLELKKSNLIQIKFSKDLLKKNIKESYPIAMQEICFPIYSFCLNYIILFIIGSEFLGLYSTIMSIYVMILFIPGILRNVMLKYFSSLENKKNVHSDKRKIFQISIIINLISTIFPLILVNIFSSKITLFLGESFNDIERLYLPMSLMAIVAATANPFYQIYISNNLNWNLFKIRALRDLFALILILFMASTFNYSGKTILIFILIISAVMSVLQLLFMYYDSRRKGLI